jgi:predicted house-cleaning NTP pyrophosphatase (Maf/HAM1 superfamily)
MKPLTLALVIGLMTPILSLPAQSHADKQALEVEQRLSAAVASNDVRTLRRLLAPEWTIIGADGSVISRTRFLELIASGALHHEQLSSTDPRIISFASTVVISARSHSAGTFKLAAFETDEMSTDVLVSSGGRWRCVLTQLSPISLRN